MACKFWLGIVRPGYYDAVNDVVLCPSPEQPILLRDNGNNLISLSVTLNQMIADQCVSPSLLPPPSTPPSLCFDQFDLTTV